MQRERVKIGLFLLVGLLFAAGCATTSNLSNRWVDRSYDGPPLKKILVVGMADKESTRLSFEYEFSMLLEKKGVEAISSAELAGADVQLTKEAIQDLVKGADVDAVLVCRPVGIEEKEKYVPGRTEYVPVPYYRTYGDYIGYTYDQVYTPGYTTKYQVVTIESNIYSRKTEKLLWTATSETISPASIEDLIKSIGKVIVKDLQEKGLIASK